MEAVLDKYTFQKALQGPYAIVLTGDSLQRLMSSTVGPQPVELLAGGSRSLGASCLWLFPVPLNFLATVLQSCSLCLVVPNILD